MGNKHAHAPRRDVRDQVAGFTVKAARAAPDDALAGLPLATATVSEPHRLSSWIDKKRAPSCGAQTAGARKGRGL